MTPVITLDFENKRDPLVLVYDFFVFGPRGFEVVLEAGFRSDGGSIPRWLWWFVDRFAPTFLIAFLVHDYMYRMTDDSRLLADVRLRELALQCKANRAKVFIVYYVLRLTGWWAWRKNRREKMKCA